MNLSHTAFISAELFSIYRFGPASGVPSFVAAAEERTGNEGREHVQDGRKCRLP